MNKKRVHIILIPSVILIWILVLHRIFSLTGSVSNQPDLNLLLPEPAESNLFASENMELLLNYRDPFGTIEYFIRERIDFEPVPEPVFITEEIMPIPSIRYIGLIEKNDNTNGIAMALINERSRLLQEGDTLMGLKVKKIYRDSIIVEFNKMSLKYLKSN